MDEGYLLKNNKPQIHGDERRFANSASSFIRAFSLCALCGEIKTCTATKNAKGGAINGGS